MQLGEQTLDLWADPGVRPPRLGGFQLLDTQFVTAHLTQFGAEEIPRQAYREHLTAALAAPARWLPAPAPAALIAEFRALAGQSPA